MLGKNKALNLTEADIRYAMKNSKSNAGAALFIGCSYSSYQKYAKMYRDKDTNKTLWDIHRNQAGKGVHKHFKTPNNPAFVKADIMDILEGKHPTYNRKILKNRLIDEGIKDECCENCGFDERRITDYQVPLILCWKDGDKTNHRLENLEFICLNCYFLLYDDIQHRADVARFAIRK